MKKLVILILICFGSNAFSQECYLQDWEALKGLYLSTNGDNWTDTTGWTYIKNATGPNVECPPSPIYGIVTDTTDSFEIVGRGVIVLTSVTKIALSYNNLTGSLDSTIGSFSHMFSLRMGSNKLYGNIPKEIGNLTSLKYLHLWRNNFSGPLPFEIANLEVHGFLISDNYLTGNPLSYLPKANYLRHLDLNNNLFEGNVNNLDRPNAYFNYIDLSHNNFYGSLPASIAHDQYTYIDFSNTKISGCLPSSFSQLCSSLDPEDAIITNNNDIVTSWSDFCAYGKGTCIQCNYEINFNSPTDDFNRGKGEYLTPGYDTIYATNKLTGDVNMIYNAGSVILEPGFQADAGTVFEAKTGGCGFP